MNRAPIVNVLFITVTSLMSMVFIHSMFDAFIILPKT